MFIFSPLHVLLHVSLYQAPSPRSVSSAFTRHALSPQSAADCLLQAGGLSVPGSSRTGNFLISPPSPCLFTPFSAKIFHILISTWMLKHFYRSIKLTNNPSLFHSLPLTGMILHFPLTSISSFPSPLSYPPHHHFSIPAPPPSPFLFFILCLEVTAKRASFSEKQKEWIDWVISCCSGGPFDQTWKAALHVRILLLQLFLSFTITTHHGHIQSFPHHVVLGLGPVAMNISAPPFLCFPQQRERLCSGVVLHREFCRHSISADILRPGCRDKHRPHVTHPPTCKCQVHGNWCWKLTSNRG